MSHEYYRRSVSQKSFVFAVKSETTVYATPIKTTKNRAINSGTVFNDPVYADHPALPARNYKDDPLTKISKLKLLKALFTFQCCKLKDDSAMDISGTNESINKEGP